jgi:hypothetical protein
MDRRGKIVTITGRTAASTGRPRSIFRGAARNGDRSDSPLDVAAFGR